MTFQYRQDHLETVLVLMSDWHRSKSRCKGAPLMKSGGWLSVQTRRLSSRRTSGVVMGIGARLSRFLPGIAQPTLAGFLVFLAQAGPPASFKCSLGSLAGHRGQCQRSSGRWGWSQLRGRLLVFYTSADLLCSPVAPLGLGGLASSICGVPSASTQRTSKVWLPSEKGQS